MGDRLVVVLLLATGAVAAALVALSRVEIYPARPTVPKGPAWTVPDPLPAASGLASFEFLGCSGTWPNANLTPQAWLTGRKGRTSLLVRHPADCGYTIGADPVAKVSGSSVDLGYSMSNEDGAVAACFCEYWASFELLETPQAIGRVRINGDTAELMGDLADR